MGFRFRRTVRLLPGVRANLSKSGVSLSLGGPGATVNLAPRGARATFGLPGTGMSYRTPTFAPQAGGRGRFVQQQQLDPINTSQGLLDSVNDARRTVVYINSGRRLSAQQLAAAYRRLQEGES